MGETELSIVIAAWNNTSYLEACLASLEGQIGTGTIEVIVTSNYEIATEHKKQASSNVQFVRLPPETTVPELRAAGVLRSKGKIIALLEDHLTCDANWCSGILKGHELEYAIVGGAIENGPHQGPLDWAVYFYDYAKFMLPVREKVVKALSGANVSYKREVLSEIESVYRDGFYESTVHDELQKRGNVLYLEPLAVTYHNKNYLLKETLSQTYHQARGYAARRVSGARRSSSFVFGIVSLGLPFVLVSRITLGVLRKGRHFKELVRSSPYLLPLLTVWAYGEFCGYHFGEGNSAGEWR